MPDLICHLKSYIQPFERQLAFDELRAMVTGDISPVDGTDETAHKFLVNSNDSDRLRDNLAYWQSVEINSSQQLTAQLRHEATSIVARNGVALEELTSSVEGLIPEKIPTKRCLRYATHGIHEYRGKFFPQLVRSLINSANIPDDGIVLDPMCGSGTTLVETALSNRQAYGLDMNPLSVFISNVKCKTLGLDADQLISSYLDLEQRIEDQSSPSLEGGYFSGLLVPDQEYLNKWFASNTLSELDNIALGISAFNDTDIRDFFRVCLSNILRNVSWQKNADLRVRKEKTSLSTGETSRLFLKEARRSTRLVAAFLTERRNESIGKHHVVEASATAASTALVDLMGKVDAVITSPPYATALPYLDTDRLSLLYLGLLNRKEHRSRDQLMIGNREISERMRLSLWELYLKNRNKLPSSVRGVIERIDHLNSNHEVGFRRRNLAALLSKYFFDMSDVMEEQSKLLRADGYFFMVVGNNRTTAGGVEVEICTAELLTDIALQSGFNLHRSLPMEMLVSRDIFRRNAMPSEKIVTLIKA